MRSSIAAQVAAREWRYRASGASQIDLKRAHLSSCHCTGNALQLLAQPKWAEDVVQDARVKTSASVSRREKRGHARPIHE